MASRITGQHRIKDVLEIDAGLAKCFREFGMHCIDCPAARAETIEEACMVHGVDCEKLLEMLNRKLGL